MAKPDNVLTKIHDLLLYIIPQLNKFPRNQKFVLGDRIQVKVMDVQELCLRAYYGRNKRLELLDANLQLEVTRHLVRLSYNLRLINGKAYGVISEKIDEVGRMIGGWIKSLDKTGKNVQGKVNA